MKHLKILFADDDLRYAMILKRFLEAEGMRCSMPAMDGLLWSNIPK